MADFITFLFFTTSFIKNRGNKNSLKIQKKFLKNAITQAQTDGGDKLAKPVSIVTALGLFESPFHANSESTKQFGGSIFGFSEKKPRRWPARQNVTSAKAEGCGTLSLPFSI